MKNRLAYCTWYVQFPTRATIGVLLQAGANINHRNKAGYSVLDTMARCRCETAVRFLVDKGADVNF